MNALTGDIYEFIPSENIAVKTARKLINKFSITRAEQEDTIIYHDYVQCMS